MGPAESGDDWDNARIFGYSGSAGSGQLRTESGRIGGEPFRGLFGAGVKPANSSRTVGIRNMHLTSGLHASFIIKIELV